MIMDEIFEFWGSMLLIVAILAISAGLFGIIWNSDMPMWLKWFLLR